MDDTTLIKSCSHLSDKISLSVSLSVYMCVYMNILMKNIDTFAH